MENIHTTQVDLHRGGGAVDLHRGGRAVDLHRGGGAVDFHRGGGAVGDERWGGGRWIYKVPHSSGFISLTLIHFITWK